MAERELAEIKASPMRRVVGVAAMMGLGALLVYLALAHPPESILWRLFLVALGLGAVWLGHWMWRATAESLILTEAELRESGGTVLARMDNIDKVERGTFAMKPSNGFNIILKQPEERAWRPGLWWRIGRRVAVGGVTAGSQTRPVADIIQLRLHERGDLDL